MSRNRMFGLFLAGALIHCTKEAPAPSRGSDAAVQVDPLATFGQKAGEIRALAFANPEGAEPELVKAIEGAKALPRKPDSWLVLGAEWIRKARKSGDPGYYKHAAICAEVVGMLEPDNLGGLALLGAVKLSDHEFRSASEIGQKILKIDPQNAVALGMVSDAALELGEYEKAISAADEMGGKRPDLRSYARIAYLRWIRGDRAGAKVAYRAAIEAGQGNAPAESVAWAIVEAAHVFWHEGDYEGAEKGYELALTTMPEYAPALLGRARASAAMEKFGVAADFARQALAKRPLVEAAAMLYDILLAQGDAAGAAKLETELERLGKSDPRTYAWHLATHSLMPEKALSLAKQELDLRPNDISRQVAAWALYRAGQFDEAGKLIEPVIARGTPDARLWYYAGAIRMARGEKEKGKKLIREALKLNPRFHPTESLEAQKLIK